MEYDVVATEGELKERLDALRASCRGLTTGQRYEKRSGEFVQECVLFDRLLVPCACAA